MTPFRLRLLVVAFLAMATAISVNALYFQQGSGLSVSAASAVKTVPASGGAALPANDAAQASGITAALPSPAPQSKPASSGPASQAPAARTPASQVAMTEAAPTQPIATQAIAPQAIATQASAPQSAAPQPRAPEQPTPLVRSLQKKLKRFGYKALPQDGLPGPDTRAAILAAEFALGRPLSGEPAESVLSALYFLEAAGRTTLATSDGFERDPTLVKEVQDVLARLGYASGALDGRLDAKTRDALKRFEADRRLKGEGGLTERVILEMVIERGKPFPAKG